MTHHHHPGPYTNEDGDVWVPRTVPYREARSVAKEVVDAPWQRLRYIGKDDALMFGFVTDCRCEWECERLTRWNGETAEDEETGDRTCYAPAWAFVVEER